MLIRPDPDPVVEAVTINELYRARVWGRKLRLSDSHDNVLPAHEAAKFNGMLFCVGLDPRGRSVARPHRFLG
jgi:hypothetical protein